MYIDLSNGTIKRESDGAIIPSDPGNIDFQHYLSWVSAGNLAVQQAASVPKVVDTISMRQARLCLLAQGLYTTVEQYMLTASPESKIWWETSLSVRRDNAYVADVMLVLGVTEEVMDSLFALAKQFD